MTAQPCIVSVCTPKYLYIVSPLFFSSFLCSLILFCSPPAGVYLVLGLIYLSFSDAPAVAGWIGKSGDFTVHRSEGVEQKKMPACLLAARFKRYRFILRSMNPGFYGPFRVQLTTLLIVELSISFAFEDIIL